MNEDKKVVKMKSPSCPANHTEPVKLKHVRFHLGVQVGTNVGMYLDAEKSNHVLELWGLPNGSVLAVVELPKASKPQEKEVQKHRIGQAVIHSWIEE